MSISINKKAQSAIEIMIILGAIVVFFALFLAVLAGDFSDSYKRKESLMLKEIALQVQTEVNLASKSSEGYSRTFKLPTSLNGKNYSINITDSRVFVRTQENAITISLETTSGEISKGENTIRKSNGKIYINQ